MSDTLKLLRELSEHFDELSVAADMLELFLNQMQMHSPKMDGVGQ